jgi:hypothetical protein
VQPFTFHIDPINFAIEQEILVHPLFHTKPWLIVLGLAGAAVLAGCAKKPPGCADPETVKTLNTIVVDNVRALMPKFTGGENQDDPKNIQESYYQGLKSELVNVVSNGYNEQAKLNTCRGNLSVSTPSGEKFSRDISYTTQRTEDKDSQFLVEVQAFQPFIMAVSGDLTGYYFGKRYKGEWKGEYKCAGIDGATDGPQGPFSMPVSMVVDENRVAVLERTTKGGGVESLTGEVSSTVRLNGTGKNSPDDTWRTAFEGKVQGMDFSAQGGIVTEDNRLLRECRLKLTLPSN